MNMMRQLLMGIPLFFADMAAAQDRLAFAAAKPEEVGLKAENLQAIADEVAGYVKAGTIVGAELLIIKNRKTIRNVSTSLRPIFLICTEGVHCVD